MILKSFFFLLLSDRFHSFVLLFTHFFLSLFLCLYLSIYSFLISLQSLSIFVFSLPLNHQNSPFVFPYIPYSVLFHLSLSQCLPFLLDSDLRSITQILFSFPSPNIIYIYRNSCLSYFKYFLLTDRYIAIGGNRERGKKGRVKK